MSRVTVYSTAHCSFCNMTKVKLDQWNLPLEAARILIDGKVIGGFSELTELHMDGELDELMEAD